MVAETKLYYYSEVLNDDLLDRFAPAGEMGIIADFATPILLLRLLKTHIPHFKK